MSDYFALSGHALHRKDSGIEARGRSLAETTRHMKAVMTTELPKAFADLLPIVDWGLPTEFERNTRRWSVTLEERVNSLRANTPRSGCSTL